MGLVTSMYSGVSGITSNAANLSVISNNIANVNTVGFKSGKTVFSDLLSTVLANGTSSLQYGHGTQISAINSSFQQGSFESTTSATDFAVDGNGFFVVNNGTNNVYTRSGQFKMDNSGKLSNPQGFTLQGYTITNGVVGATLQDIDLAGVQSRPQATTTFTAGANLNATASATTTFSTPITMFNSVGQQVVLDITFTKAATGNAWTFSPTSSIAGSTVNMNGVASGTVTFNTSGTLATINGQTVGAGAANPVFNFDYSGSNPPSAAQAVTWELLNTAGTASNGKITGFAAGSNNNSLVQDGFTTGVLVGLSVDSTGIISGLFDNGQTQQLNQIALANFLNPDGLQKLGSNIFAESAKSGAATVGVAESGGFGSIIGDTLELSNVDLANEFVRMITTQQAYQAAARTITTADDLMTEAINLKR